MTTFTHQYPTRILLITPTFDIATFAATYIGSKFQALTISNPTLIIKQLSGLVANCWNIRNILKADLTKSEDQQYQIVMYLGHGNDTAWIGPFGDLIDTNQANLFKGKFVLTMACESANELSLAMVDAGATWYIGNYQTVYGTATQTPLNFAQLFAQVWLNMMTQTVFGYAYGLGSATAIVSTAYDNWNNVISTITDYININSLSPAHLSVCQEHIQYATANRNSLIAYGHTDAFYEPTTYQNDTPIEVIDTLKTTED